MNVVRIANVILYTEHLTFSLTDRSLQSSVPWHSAGHGVVECKLQEHLRNLNVLFSVFKREERQVG